MYHRPRCAVLGRASDQPRARRRARPRRGAALGDGGSRTASPEEAEGFRALARVRLDAMVRDQVIGDLDETERQALAMLEDRRREIDELARRRDEAQAALDKAEAAKHDARSGARRCARSASTSCADRTAERIKADDRWRKAKAAVETAEEIADNADEKAAEAEADLDGEGQALRGRSAVHVSLDQEHAQAEDRSGSFVRFFDREGRASRRLSGCTRELRDAARKFRSRLREHAKNKENDVDDGESASRRDRAQGAGRRRYRTARSAVEAAHAAMKSAEDAVVKITAELAEDRSGAADGSSSRRREERTARGRSAGASARARRSEPALPEASSTPTTADDQAISVDLARARGASRRPTARWHRSAPSSARWRTGAPSSKARATARAASATTIRAGASAADAGHHRAGDRRNPRGRAARRRAGSRPARHVPARPAARLRHGHSGATWVPADFRSRFRARGAACRRHCPARGDACQDRCRCPDPGAVAAGEAAAGAQAGVWAVAGAKAVAGKPAGGSRRYTPTSAGNASSDTITRSGCPGRRSGFWP